MVKKLYSILGIASLLILGGIHIVNATSCITGEQGGTNTCVTSSSNIGKALIVSSTDSRGNVTWTLGTAGGSGGSGTIGPSTSTYICVFNSSSTCSGYPGFTYTSSTDTIFASNIQGPGSFGYLTLKAGPLGGFIMQNSIGNQFISLDPFGGINIEPLFSSGFQISDNVSGNGISLDTSLQTQVNNFKFPNEAGIFALGGNNGIAGTCATWSDSNTLTNTGAPCGSGGGGSTSVTSTYVAFGNSINVVTGSPALTYVTSTNTFSNGNASTTGFVFDFLQSATTTGYVSVNNTFNTMNIGTKSTSSLYFNTDNTPVADFDSSGTFTLGGAGSNPLINFKILPTYGYLQVQSNGVGDNGENTIEEILAPTSSPQEATISFQRIASTTGLSEWTDIGDENYNVTDTTALDGGVDPYSFWDISKSTTTLKFHDFIMRFWNQSLGSVNSVGVSAIQVSPTGSVALGAYATTSYNHANALNILANSNDTANGIEVDHFNSSTPVFKVANTGNGTFTGSVIVDTSGTINTPANFFYIQPNTTGGAQIGSFGSAFSSLLIDAAPIDIGYRTTGESLNIGLVTSTVPTTIFGSLTQSSGTVSEASTTVNGTLTLSPLTGTQCLHEVSSLVSGTGSDCGSGTVNAASATDIAFYNATTTIQGTMNLQYLPSSNFGNPAVSVNEVDTNVITPQSGSTLTIAGGNVSFSPVNSNGIKIQNPISFGGFATFDTTLIGTNSYNYQFPASSGIFCLTVTCGPPTSTLNGLYLQIANNLSDIINTSTARTNLGLGSSATHPTTDYLPSSTTYVASLNGQTGAATYSVTCASGCTATTSTTSTAITVTGGGSGNGNLFVTPTSSVLANNEVVYSTNGSSTVRATSSIYSFTNGDNTVNSSSDNGLLSVVNASQTVAFSVASTTNNNLALLLGNHLGFATSSVSVTSCGTGSPTILGSDDAGTVLTGTSASSCTVNFAKNWVNPPVCTMSDSNTTAVVDISSITSSSVVFSMASALSSVNIYYTCFGNPQ